MQFTLIRTLSIRNQSALDVHLSGVLLETVTRMHDELAFISHPYRLSSIDSPTVIQSPTPFFSRYATKQELSASIRIEALSIRGLLIMQQSIRVDSIVCHTQTYLTRRPAPRRPESHVANGIGSVVHR